MSLPEIPQSWLIGLLLAGLIVLRIFGIDSWTTAALSMIIGYLTGKHIESVRNSVYPETCTISKETIKNSV